MPTLQELRRDLTPEQQALFDEIWTIYKETNEWPTAWLFHSPGRKKYVQDTLRPLNGSIIEEQYDAQHGGRYRLWLIGILLTNDGNSIHSMLVRYFNFMHKRYKQRLPDRHIRCEEVRAALKLSDTETMLLGKLIMMGNIYSQSASHDAKWEKLDWGAGILDIVEDFSADANMENELEKFLFRHYNPLVPVLLKDKQQANSRQWLTEPESTSDMQRTELDEQTVFVVHGRNEDIRRAVFDFLRCIGLKPLEWSEAVSATGIGTPSIPGILDQAFLKAQAVVVVLTPDDEAYLKEEFHNEHDDPDEAKPTGQARPNVLFEAGMAMGRNLDRTVIVQIGKVKKFSDISGLHVLHLNDSPERRQDLAERLKTTGCKVNLGGRDWLSVGSFSLKEHKKLPILDMAHAPTKSLEENMGALWKRTKDGFEKHPYCRECPSHPVMTPMPPRRPQLWECPAGHFVPLSVVPPT